MLLTSCLLLVAAAGGPTSADPVKDGVSTAAVELTREERKWLAAHPVLRVGIDPDFAPYEFIDHAGRYSGIAASYVRLLSRRLGVDLRVEPGLGWQEVLDKARNGELDVVAALAKTPERARFLGFTRVYVKFPFVIVTRDDDRGVHGVSDLSGKRVALVRAYAATELTLEHNPAIEPVIVDSVEESLRAVAFGKADAAVGDLASIDYATQEHMLANLKVAAETELQTHGLRMGVRADWPILASILDKALASVTALEHRTIRRQWVGTEQDSEPESDVQVMLTDAERAWIRQHPRVVLAISSQWAPAVVEAADGSIEGIMPKLLDLLNRRLGTNIRLEAGNWQEMVAKAERYEVDGLAVAAAQPSRDRYFDFTVPYAHANQYLFVRSDSAPVASLDELEGKRIAYTGANALDLLHLRRHPKIELVECTDIDEKIERLLNGQVDAAVGSTPLLYRLLHGPRMDIRMAFPLSDAPEDLVFAIRKDWPELVGIIDKGLASITPAERAAIYRPWLPAGDGPAAKHSPVRVTLTSQEQEWLRAHPVVRVGYDPYWAPLGFTDRNGDFAGVCADYLTELGERLDIRFEIEQSPSRHEIMEKLRAGDLDLVPGVLATQERTQYLDFTQPVFSTPIVIYARPDLPYVGKLGELSGKKVLVVDQYATAQLLRRDHPDIELITVDNTPDALSRLSRGEATAFVGDLLTAGYYIGQLGLSDLKVVGQTSYSFDPSIAVRGDWPILAGLLRKGLDAIPEERRNAIYRSWIAVRYERGLDRSLLWKILALGTALLLAIILWNRSLAHQVTQRTNQFREELQRRRQSEERFRLLYEDAPLPYQSLDAEGRFLAVNQAFEAALGYTRDEVIGHPFSELIPGAEHALFKQRFKGFIESGQVHAGLSLVRKDGTLIHTDLAGVVARRSDESVLQTHCVWVDVTERKRAERALREYQEHLEQSVQARTTELENEISRRRRIEAELLVAKDRAEAASNAKSVFLANISHELRTPLNAILGYARILQKRPDATESQLEGLGIIERGGEHLHTLINDILDIARIEAGRLVLEPTAFRLKRFLGELVAVVGTRASAKGVEVVLITARGLPAAIVADQKRLRQVLLNLLSNAVKFTNQGRVLLRVSPANDENRVGQCRLIFEVQDTGIGIAADQLTRIFQPFEQIGQRAQEEGTGLGLAIVKQLVEKMGGTIEVESAPGRGSRFWFALDLPIEEIPETATVERPNRVCGYQGPRRRILVVDDNENNRLLLKELLEPTGFIVDLAEGGEEALRIVHDPRPDLVFLDILMPEMNGYAVLAALRRDPPLRGLPVVAVSAGVSEAQKATANDAGFEGFLGKPFSPEELHAIVGDLLGLVWLTGGESGSPDSLEEPIEPPPADELIEPAQLLTLGKLLRIVEWAEALERRAPRYASFAGRVRRLARDIDEEGLRSLLGAG